LPKFLIQYISIVIKTHVEKQISNLKYSLCAVLVMRETVIENGETYSTIYVYLF